MAGRLRAGLQRLTRPTLLGKLDRLLEDLVRLSTDERITLDEEKSRGFPINWPRLPDEEKGVYVLFYCVLFSVASAVRLGGA